MKKINKTLFKSLALALGVCSLVPLTACGGDKSKVQVWDAEKAYATAASQGFTGTYEEFLQQMAGIKSINIDSNGHLIFVLGDDSEVDAGIVTGRKGQDGKGIKEVTTAYDHVQKKTVVTITFTDDTQQSFDILDASQGEKGEQGDKGDAGVGIANITVDETDRWKIVHKLKYTMTDNTSYTFDVGFGVVYGRSYDVENYDELKYVLDHGVKDIVLTKDITIPTSKGRLFLSAQNNEDTYYKFDLNGHTLNGALWIDATDAESKDLTYGAYADVMNGKINSADLDNPVLDYGLVVYGSHTGVKLTNMEVYGYKAGLSTNGLYSGVEIVAENCKFYGTGNGYAKALLDSEIKPEEKFKKASLGAFLPAYGNYDFTHCWFEGELGVNAKSGEITFENCHIEGTSEYTAPKYNNNGSSGTGSALVVTSTIGYQRPMNITIKDSELISHHGYALEEVKLGPVAGEEVCYTTITIKNSDLQSTTDAEEGSTRFNAFYTQNNVVSCYDDGGSLNDYIQAGASTIYIVDKKGKEGKVYQTIDVARSSAELASLVEADKEMIHAILTNGETSYAIPAAILAKYKVDVLEDDFAVLSRVNAINMQVLGEGQYEGRTDDLKLDLNSGNATQAFVITNPAETKIRLSFIKDANQYFTMKLKKQVATTKKVKGVNVITGVEMVEVTDLDKVYLKANSSATFFYELTPTAEGTELIQRYFDKEDMKGYMDFMLDLKFGVSVHAVEELEEVEVGSYDELRKALKSDCDIIKLTADIDSDKTIYISSRKVSFNLNGKTLKGSGYDGVFCVKGNGNLTITGNGNIVAKEDNGYAMAIWAKSNAKVTIENGNFSQTITGSDTQYDMIYVSDSAQITILDGHFESVTPAWTLNKLDANRSTAGLFVKGGTYVEFNPADCLTEGPNTNFVAEGYKSEKIEGTNNYRVVKIAE